MSTNDTNTTTGISQEQRLARIIDVCEQVNMDAICAHWVVTTGESLITLRTIALNRVIEAWNPDFDTKDISATGSTVTGQTYSIINYAMKEHYAFIANHGRIVEQYPENDSIELIPLTLVEKEYSQAYQDLINITRQDFGLAGSTQEVNKVTHMGRKIHDAYIKKYGRKEWETIDRLDTARPAPRSIHDSTRPLTTQEKTTLTFASGHGDQKSMSLIHINTTRRYNSYM